MKELKRFIRELKLRDVSCVTLVKWFEDTEEAVDLENLLGVIEKMGIEDVLGRDFEIFILTTNDGGYIEIYEFC